MKFLRPTVLALVAAAVAAPALATPNTMHAMHNSMATQNLNFNMGEQNESKQNGTGTVKAVPGGVWVKISVFNEPKGASEPAHIHQGPCSKLNPAPWKKLNDVVNGTSITTIKGVSFDQMKKGHYSANVHESSANLKHYVSCGDI